MDLQLRLLFIDAYDSFSNNIIALLEAECGVQITRIAIDDAPIGEFNEFLAPFHSVVCGPGPGHPANHRDVGLFKKVWTASEESLRPVLGICLGFQSLAYEFGASVDRLPQPRHGVKTSITTCSASIFDGLATIDAVQYHSLHASLSDDAPQSATDGRLWAAPRRCPQLQPLAWDLNSQPGVDPRFSKNPKAILMAVKHVSKPFYGVQFHPESVCSGSSARKVVSNWWQMVQAWWLERNSGLKMLGIRVDSVNQKTEQGSNDTRLRNSFDSSRSDSSLSSSRATSIEPSTRSRQRLISATLPIAHMTIPSICEALGLPAKELVVLDSEMRQLPQIGETSIIGVIQPETKIIQYSTGQNKVILYSGATDEILDLERHGSNVFMFLKSFMADFVMESGHEGLFCGGLMGYISYEVCLETIGIDVQQASSHPDLCFAFVRRSIVIDHKHRLVHVQELLDEGHDCTNVDWVGMTSSNLKILSERPCPPLVTQKVLEVNLPEQTKYKSKIAQCQELINAGESYELCLTDQTAVSFKDDLPAWELYLHLRQLNPANFGAFVRLGPLTVLSTSPERFMSWSRFESLPSDPAGPGNPADQVATCQFRPMKGTVGKRRIMGDGSMHEVSPDEAAKMLASPKEQAENLMILDLIRHDLHSVCRDVSVPGLMVIEDYESVYQMVSVVEGKLIKPSCLDAGDGLTGIDCLAASLPPGSMTGAPKKRSCQLLQKIEGKPRSIYSGVLGYIDIRGNGDFSVIIRSMYRWNDESEPCRQEWNIGAGGAITTLSTEEGEWEEMFTKLQSTLRVFDTKPP